MPKVSTNGGIDCVKKDQKSISPILSNPGLNADSWAIRANSLYTLKFRDENSPSLGKLKVLLHSVSSDFWSDAPFVQKNAT